MVQFVTDLSQSIGLPEDQLKYIICMISAYPLAFIHRSLPDSPSLKHAYSGVLGLAMGYFCFGPSILHAVLTSVAAYLVVLFVKGPMAPYIVFVGLMAHLSISHLFRQWEDYGGYELDYTGPQMILIIKLTSFAFNVYDGARFRSNGASPQGSQPSSIVDELKARSLDKIPSPLEFFGYVFFFGGFLAGPAIEMYEYLGFTNMTIFPKRNNRHYIPPSLLPSLRVLFFCILCYVGVVLRGMYSVNYMTEPEFFDQGFVYKYMYMQLSVSLHRFQYYFIWLLAEGACILSGLGYVQVTDKVSGKVSERWDRCSNVDIVALETSQNFKSITDSWNKKTNNWLRYYIYLRLSPDGKQSTFATYATYACSAFWHGFYPGYYITFFSGAMMTSLARILRQKVRPRFFHKDGVTPRPTKPLYDLLSWIATFSTLNYLCSSFVLLDLAHGLNLFRSNYFLNHVVAIALFGILSFVPKPRSPAAAPQEAKKEKKEL